MNEISDFLKKSSLKDNENIKISTLIKFAKENKHVNEFFDKISGKMIEEINENS